MDDIKRLKPKSCLFSIAIVICDMYVIPGFDKEKQTRERGDDHFVLGLLIEIFVYLFKSKCMGRAKKRIGKCVGLQAKATKFHFTFFVQLNVINSTGRKYCYK